MFKWLGDYLSWVYEHSTLMLIAFLVSAFLGWLSVRKTFGIFGNIEDHDSRYVSLWMWTMILLIITSIVLALSLICSVFKAF